MVQDANRDEGRKCLLIARQSIERGDIDKARRFAEKAHKLYPGDESMNMVREVEVLQRSAPGVSADTRPSSSSQTSVDTSKETTRQRTRATSQSSTSHGTAEQKALVRTIRSKKCHYEVLSVSKTADDDDIKRAYRKLALKLHPDKNKAPGADEAFKMVSKAFSVLSNPNERSQYDMYGDVDSMPRTNFRGPRYTRTSFNGQEIDPEEIFRMFFGGNPFMGATFSTGVPRAHRQRQTQHQQTTGTPPILRLLISLAPVILLFLFNLFSNGGPSPYSLEQTREYPFPLSTSAHNIQYFVPNKSKFAKDYRFGSQERTRLEYQIESTWKEVMQKKCYQEKLVRHRYEYYGQPEKAAKYPLTSCEALKEKFQ